MAHTVIKPVRPRTFARHRPSVLERLSLRVKLVGIAALGILFVLAVGLVALSGLQTLDVTGSTAARLARAQQFHAEVLQELAELRSTVIADRETAPRSASAAAVETHITALRGLLADLGSVDLNSAPLARSVSLFSQRAIAITAAARRSEDGTALAAAAVARELASIREASARLQSDLNAGVVATGHSAQAARATARERIMLAAGLASLVLLAASHLLSMSIIRVLRRIGEAAAAVAGGHLSARAHVASQDEIGRVGQAFDDVAESLTTLLTQMESDAKRADFGRQLGEAMEMVDTEEDVLRVVERALGQIDPGAPMEMLLADSSRAHLGRAAVSPSGGAPGCGVISPYSCAAVRKGVTTTFETSDALNSCHKLRDRPGEPRSAVCVPISFMGRALGVLHATGPAGSPPAAEVRRQLTTLSRHTGTRLGTVRAFTKTELQASTDSLTGLLNRRTLENKVRELTRDRARFALAMIDLDRFKQLNDTYGHEAGDRALRLFSQVLRESVRGEDIAGRLGGEEFVVVLADCDIAGALPALERIREQLAAALASAAGPTFTVSFGVTDSTAGAELEELLRIADAGLLRAKDEGRDRIVVGTPADAAALVARAA